MEQSKGIRLLQACVDIRRQVGRLFSGGNLSQGEFFVLKMLYEKSKGQKEIGFRGFPRASFLSERLEMKRPMISRILNTLEARGYVSRIIDKSNRRSFEIQLTESGQAALKQAEQNMVGIADRLETELGEEDMEKLISLLSRTADIYRGMAGQESEESGDF